MNSPEAFGLVLHPELMVGRLPVIGRAIGGLLQQKLQARADEVAMLSVRSPAIQVVIQAQPRAYDHRSRATRPTPEEATTGVARIVEDIWTQDYSPQGVTTLLPAAWQLNDRTQRRLSATNVVRIPRGMNHAAAMNLAVGTLPNTTQAVIFLESGARLATAQAVRAAGYYLGENSAIYGVYGARLAGEKASLTESAVYTGSALLHRRLRQLNLPPTDELGMMAADRAAFAYHQLISHPFDEQYGNGGADGAWGRTLRAETEAVGGVASIVYDPVLSVHWSEDLTLGDFRAQLRDWSSFGQPNEYVIPSGLAEA